MKQKFFFKGQYFDNKEDFWKAVSEWTFEEMTMVSFLREWNHLGKDIWVNMEVNDCTKDLTNGVMNSLFQDFFLRVFQKYIAKSNDKDLI